MAARIDLIAREAAGDTRGLARTAVLVAAGIPTSTIARRVRSGAWVRPHFGVVDVTLGPWDWTRRVLAAVLANPEGTVASHTSAAALHRLPGFPLEGRIEVTTPRAGRMSSIPYKVHSSVLSDEPIMVDAVPCASGLRTLTGIATCVGERAMARATREALRRDLVDLDLLMDDALDHIPGIQRVRRVIAVEQSRALLSTESPLEDDVVDRLLRAPDVPPFVTQHVVELDGCDLRLDVAWPDARVLVEVDGGRWHADHLAARADEERQALLERHGWTVVRCTAADLADDASWGRFLARLTTALSV